jgi:hypothetical protein
VVCDTRRQHREKAAASQRRSAAIENAVFRRAGDEDIDAAIIATPDHSAPCSVTPSAPGRTSIEKPLAMNMKELVEAVDTVKKSDRVVVGTQVRSFACGRAAFVAAGGMAGSSRSSSVNPTGRTGQLRDGRSRNRCTGKRPRIIALPWNADQYRCTIPGFLMGKPDLRYLVDLVHHITGAKFPR